MKTDVIYLVRVILVVLLGLVIVGMWPRRRSMPNTYGYYPATIAGVLLLVVVLLVLFGYL